MQRPCTPKLLQHDHVAQLAKHAPNLLRLLLPVQIAYIPAQAEQAGLPFMAISDVLHGNNASIPVALAATMPKLKQLLVQLHSCHGVEVYITWQ